MEQTIRQFEDNILRIEHLVKLYEDNSINNTQEDYSDILRAALVLLVSALDTFVHNIIRLGMVEILKGERAQADDYHKTKISLGIINFDPNYEWFESHIRREHASISYQSPKQISDAIRYISKLDLWKEIGNILEKDQEILKRELKEIVDRRNQIAHESDLNDFGQKRIIEKEDILENIDFIRKLVNTIYNLLISER
jgi:hypothetical protein